MAPVGRTFPLSLPRRWIADLLHFGRKVPLTAVRRRMGLAAVAAARAAADPRPSWVAVFAKAFSLTAAEMPELRRAYLGWPWPRVYEHPESRASVAIGRRFGDEDAVLFGHLRAPEQRSLADLDARLGWLKAAPLHEVSEFRQLIRLSRLWRPLRRLAWWYGLNTSGPRRVKRFGTFGLSVISGLGVETMHLIAPATTVLSYGPIAADGSADVLFTFDHRVYDGVTVARALARMEELLHGPLLAELNGLAQRRRAA
jgi:hypothetical protein